MKLRDEVLRLKAIVAELQAEVRLLRRGRGRADEEAIEALLGYVHSDLGQEPWTVADVIAASAQNGLLLGSVRRCLGGKIDAYQLAVLLSRSCGVWGDYELRCVRDRTRDGRVFVVTGPVTLSQAKAGTVKP
jgi:hypothetical protein